jgi:uncharacterized membrane-anchored protein YitT (DUF2179 family)
MTLKVSKHDILNYIKNLILVIFGTAVLAFGTAVFIVPFDLVTGGVSGLAIVLEKIVPFALSIDFYITALTWILFFLGLIFLGRGFAIKTLLSTVFYPVLFTLFYNLVENQSFGGLLVLQNSAYNEIAVLLAAVFGGALVGAGCAITFVAGGSTGGVDVLAFLICKVFKRVKSSYVIFGVDAAIVVCGVFIINDLVLSMLGICSALVCAAVIDRVFLGSSSAYVAQIISNNSEEISSGVIEKLDRTTTIVDVKGAYSGESKKLIIVSFSMREYSDLMNIINREDPSAFMTISRVHENHGEGWTSAKK